MISGFSKFELYVAFIVLIKGILGKKILYDLFTFYEKINFFDVSFSSLWRNE